MRRGLLILLVVALLLVFGLIYYSLDPSQSELFPQCVILKYTGFKCPGCGSQRAIHALLNGDIVGAFRYNAFLLVAVPWISVCLYAESRRTRNPKLYARLNAPLLAWVLFIVVVLWWLLRNIFNW